MPTRTKPRTPSRPTIPPHRADWPKALPAMVRISPARRVEVDSKLVAASRLVTRLQAQLRLLAQELRDAEAERDHLSQVAESGEEESLVPVRIELHGCDLVAVRVDPDGQIPPGAPWVLASRPATPEDRTGLLPFDQESSRLALDADGVPEQCAALEPNTKMRCELAVGHRSFHLAQGASWPAMKSDDTPTGSAKPDLPSSEPSTPSRYAVGDRLVHPSGAVATIGHDAQTEPRWRLLGGDDAVSVCSTEDLDRGWRKATGPTGPTDGLATPPGQAPTGTDEPTRENQGSDEASGGEQDPIFTGRCTGLVGIDRCSLQEGHDDPCRSAEHELPLAVKQNQQADTPSILAMPLSDEEAEAAANIPVPPDEIKAAADAMADIMREHRRTERAQESTGPAGRVKGRGKADKAPGADLKKKLAAKRKGGAK